MGQEKLLTTRFSPPSPRESRCGYCQYTILYGTTFEGTCYYFICDTGHFQTKQITERKEKLALTFSFSSARHQAPSTQIFHSTNVLTKPKSPQNKKHATKKTYILSTTIHIKGPNPQILVLVEKRRIRFHLHLGVSLSLPPTVGVEYQTRESEVEKRERERGFSFVCHVVLIHAVAIFSFLLGIEKVMYST